MFKKIMFWMILFGIMITARGEKVAVLYQEKDSKKIKALVQTMKDCQVECFEQAEIDKMMFKLKEFDAVIVGSLIGFYKPLEWSPEYIGQWKKYIWDGGVMLILGTSYKSIQDNFLWKWGEEWKLKSEECIMLKDTQRLFRIKFDENDTICDCPCRLRSGLAKTWTWAHFTADLPKGWITIGRCPDNLSTVIMRKEGKGLVIATTQGGFNLPQLPVWQMLVKNAVFYNRAKTLDIEIKEFNLPLSFGDNTFKLFMTGRTATTLKGSLKLELDGKVIEEHNFESSGPEIKWEAPYKIEKTGLLKMILEIEDIKINMDYSVIPPVKLISTFPEVRPAIKKAVPFLVSRDAPFTDNSRYQLRIYVDNKILSDVKIKPAPEPTLLNLSDLVPGEHDVKADLIDVSTGKIVFSGPVQTFIIAENNPSVYVDTEGFLVKDGKRIFIRGFCIHYPTVKDLDFLAANGYNHFTAGTWKPEAARQLPALLDEAEKRGITVMVSGPLRDVERFHPHPAVLSWGVIDEPDINGLSPEDCLVKYSRKIHQKDKRPTSICLSQGESANMDYIWSCDIVKHDPYPISNCDIQMVYKQLKRYCDNLRGYSRAPVGVIQCFGYPGSKTWFTVIPSPEELRNMTYQGLTAGVRGIVFYILHEGPGDLPFSLYEHPDLQKEIERIGKELTQFEAFLLSGPVQEIPTGNERIVAGKWTIDGKSLTVFVNCSRETINACGMEFKPLEVKILQ